MTPEQWREVERLYALVRHLPAPQHAAALRAHGADPAVEFEVLRLLAATVGDFLEPPEVERMVELVAQHTEGWSGRRLGEFELGDEIGRGGFGVVYRARQQSLGRTVAVKVFDPRIRADSRAVERFRREALAASRLVHPNIVPVIAYGEQDGLLYYAMHYVEGWSLDQLLDVAVASPPPEVDVADVPTGVRLICGLLDALCYAHARGVLHRDIKPHNVLVDRQTQAPHLIDFGLAKIRDLDAISFTGEGAGTPRYMSPEQIVLGLGVDERSDVYSVGAVLYELLTGHPPFEGDSYDQLVYQITHDYPRAPRAWRKAVPMALQNITLKALERDRARRYRSAQEMRDDLGRFSAGGRTAAKPLSFGRHAARAAARHPRLTRLAAVLLTGGGVAALAVWPEPASAAASRASLRIEAAWPGPAAITAWRRAEGRLGFEPPVAIPVANGVAHARLAAGDYAIAVDGGDRGFAELRRWLAPERSEVIAVGAERLRADTSAMRRIGGGAVEVLCSHQPADPAARLKAVTVRVVVQPFFIDVRPVTVGDYRAYLAKVGQAEPSACSDNSAFAALWRRLGEEHEQLPMPFVTWHEATAYAEWHGKRLPTLAEWHLAVGYPDLDWLTDEMLDPARTPFNLGKAGAVDIAGWLEHAQPVGAGPLYGPNQLEQPFGNLEQWVDEPLIAFGTAPAAQYHAVGGGWTTPLRRLQRGKPWPASVGTTCSMGIGFRCARSAGPRAPPFETVEDR